MATNPMQRRTRNAFLVGAIIGLVITAFVAFVLMNQINQLKKEKNSLKSLQRSFIVLTEDIQSGTLLSEEKYESQIVQTRVNSENNFDPSTAIDENGNLKKFYAKVSLPAGTILTEDMFYAEGEQTQKDTRIIEVNTVSLPSQLIEGDYIDIRLRLPSGDSYIVLSKKRVLQANADTIWLELGEIEILVLDNAIVENYVVEGSKLEAVIYAEAGMQEAAIPTYSVSKRVLGIINDDPNITEEARTALWQRYKTEHRDNNISAALNEFSDSATSSITSGTDDEIARTKEKREEYLTELNGTY